MSWNMLREDIWTWNLPALCVHIQLTVEVILNLTWDPTLFKIVDCIKSFLLCLDLEIESMIKENVIAQTDDTGKRTWLYVQCN